MKVHELLARWSLESRQREYHHRVALSLDDITLAQLRALDEMYPGHKLEGIVADLLHIALSELEAALPYVPGPQVIREDEYGDPVYEDIGPTPRFLALVKRNIESLRKDHE